MNKINQQAFNFQFILLNTVIQTIISFLPAMLLNKTARTFSFHLLIFISYLLLSEFFMALIRNRYPFGRSLSVQLYSIKLAISSLLIILYGIKTTWQFSVILASYEVFQFLFFSSKYHYPDSFLFTFTQAFFKGIVLNMIVYLSDSFSFKIDLMLLFAVSAGIILWQTLSIQKIYSYLNRQKIFSLFSFIFVIASIAGLYYFKMQGQLSLATFIIGALGSAVIFLLSKLMKNPRKRELFLNSGVLILLFLIYINWK